VTLRFEHPSQAVDAIGPGHSIAPPSGEGSIDTSLSSWLRGPMQPPRKPSPVVHDLIEDYNAELALAQQLRDHAAKAPYPHAEKQLLELAAEEEAQAERLRAAIEALGGSVAPLDAVPQDGRNHWLRLTLDLAAKQEAGGRYLEQAVRWEQDFPAVGNLLRGLEREEQERRHGIRDMIARSDPHALN
jgi:hypothetical protein